VRAVLRRNGLARLADGFRRAHGKWTIRQTAPGRQRHSSRRQMATARQTSVETGNDLAIRRDFSDGACESSRTLSQSLYQWIERHHPKKAWGSWIERSKAACKAPVFNRAAIIMAAVPFWTFYKEPGPGCGLKSHAMNQCPAKLTRPCRTA